jgi:prepilin-type N-terminal cleavage/methylation domain-containing protein
MNNIFKGDQQEVNTPLLNLDSRCSRCFNKGIYPLAPYQHTPKNNAGFTLLEILVVLAILAVFLGIAVNNYQRYRSRLDLQQAQQTFVQTLNRARSDAKRLSQNQTLTWTAKVIKWGEKEIQLSESASVTLVKITGANTLTYTAPYGRVSSVGEYEFELQGRGDLTSSVYVYGVTGKVKAAQ